MAFRNYSSLLLTLIVTIATVQGQMKVSPPVQFVDEGGDIEFTCQVPSALLGGKGEEILYYKQQQDTIRESRLGEGKTMDEGAVRDRSYISAISDDIGHIVGYSIKISGALPQDSGNYGCVKKVPQEDLGEIVYVKVYVKRQVQTLEMFAIAPNGTEVALENGESYRLTKKENLRLMCRTTGSMPEAMISVVFGIEDKSQDMFSTESGLVLVQKNLANQDIWAYTTNLTSNEPVDIKVPQKISCQAEVEGVEGSKTFTINTSFKHKPAIQCDRVVAKEAETDVVLECKMSSDPAVTRVYWTVHLPTGNNITLDVIPTDNAPTQFDYVPGMNNTGDYTSTTLLIDRIFKNHFLNRYSVFAENAEGWTQVEAFLARDPNSGEVGSVASTVAASALLFFTTAILRLL